MSKKTLEIHARAAEAYRSGCRNPSEVVSAADLEHLAGLGVSARVLFDYAEDFVRYGEPGAADFVQVVGIRAAEYERSGHAVRPEVRSADLPAKDDRLEGVRWLPRIIVKARAFLDGCLCDEIMYGCGGDRSFLNEHGLTLAGFLEVVRDSGGDDASVLKAVRGRQA